jgi:hypothetical protein
MAPCSSWVNRLVTQSADTCSRWFLACGFFYPEDGGDTFHRNVGSRRHIPEDGILHSHRRENLKSYIVSQFIIKIEYRISLLRDVLEFGMVCTRASISIVLLFTQIGLHYHLFWPVSNFEISTRCQNSSEFPNSKFAVINVHPKQGNIKIHAGLLFHSLRRLSCVSFYCV